jgi:hypothetical protein
MESQFDFGGEEVRGAELPDDDGNEQEEAKEEGSGDEMVLGVGDILILPASPLLSPLETLLQFLIDLWHTFISSRISLVLPIISSKSLFCRVRAGHAA